MKIVITGGPCSGKTTLVNKLKEEGFGVLEEVAREIIKTWQSHNKQLNQTNFYDLQKEIYEVQVRKEFAIDKTSKDYFLDRGWIDGHAYFRHHLGKIPNEFLTAPVKDYAAVFVLERLPLINDSVRLEDEVTAQALHEELTRSYVNSGYIPIMLPAIGVENRRKLILSHSIGIRKNYEKTLMEAI